MALWILRDKGNELCSWNTQMNKKSIHSIIHLCAYPTLTHTSEWLRFCPVWKCNLVKALWWEANFLFLCLPTAQTQSDQVPPKEFFRETIYLVPHLKAISVLPTCLNMPPASEKRAVSGLWKGQGIFPFHCEQSGLDESQSLHSIWRESKKAY